MGHLWVQTWMCSISDGFGDPLGDYLGNIHSGCNCVILGVDIGVGMRNLFLIYTYIYSFISSDFLFSGNLSFGCPGEAFLDSFWEVSGSLGTVFVTFHGIAKRYDFVEISMFPGTSPAAQI